MRSMWFMGLAIAEVGLLTFEKLLGLAHLWCVSARKDEQSSREYPGIELLAARTAS